MSSFEHVNPEPVQSPHRCGSVAVVADELRQFEARDLGQVGEQGLDAPGALALRPAEEALALDVLLVVGLLHAGDCLLDARRRDRRPLQGDRAAGAGTVTAEIHLVVRDQLAVLAFALAVDADVA